MRVLVTGGAGFIGSAVLRHFIHNTAHTVLNVDALTYAGNLESLREINSSPRYSFLHQDICNREKMDEAFETFQPEAIIHLAAESHVDRSIDGPRRFVETNIVGTYTLLEAARSYWNELSAPARSRFRFLHVSTDEVFGDLDDTGGFFTEDSAFAPSSPYSATKAGSDHLVAAWHRTYGFPTLVTHCSNNYGPYHFPEKLIPLMILNALSGRPLPVYGQGHQVRDWLFVEDHVKALTRVLEKGVVGRSYNIGGHNEQRNIDVVHKICALLEKFAPEKPEGLTAYENLITFVPDRPGHDKRYAIDASRLELELDWRPIETFDSGLEKTVLWYIANQEWCRQVQDRSYKGERLGLAGSSHVAA